MANAMGGTAQGLGKPAWWHFAALMAGNAALAVGPWSVRLADSGPVSAAFWRLALAAPILFAIARYNGERLTGFAPKVWWAMAGAGLFFALDLGAWHVGIELTKMGNATLFGNSGSLILVAWGLIALGRLPRSNEWLAFAAAIAGAAILLGRSLELGTETLIGDLFCLLAGLLYAGYILLLQGPRRTLGSWSLVAWSSIAGAPVLLAIGLAMGEPVIGERWGPLVVLALLSQVIGQGLLIYCLRHFSALVFGLALLTQPAIAAVVGWLVFGEALGWLDLAGMVLVGAGLALARGSEDEAKPSTNL